MERPSISRASINHLDAAYRALVNELGLSVVHRDHLLNDRGLPPQRLGHFASVLDNMDWTDRVEVASRIIRRVGTLVGVPGFYRLHQQWALVPAAAGFIIPALDRFGRIQGFQVRADCPADGVSRYKWLSSGPWGGASSGTPIAVWNPDLATSGVWITEGSLKGLIAAEHLIACVIAVAGIDAWQSAKDNGTAVKAGVVELLDNTPDNVSITVAYDADVNDNLHVWRARELLVRALRSAGHRVVVASWDGALAKGIDDALLSGLTIDVCPWVPSLAPVKRDWNLSKRWQARLAAVRSPAVTV